MTRDDITSAADAADAARLWAETHANPYALLSDAELARYIKRAWYDAARAWSEARAYRAGAPDRLGRFPADALLRSAADSADAYWCTLTDERRRRAGLEILR